MTAFLAIDTSTNGCSVAVNIDGVISEDFVVAEQDHTQRLLPMVEKILNTTNISLNDLDAIAFSSGPGSFTGLRICLGVVQGLAYGADVPVIGVSTLEVMAATALRTMDEALSKYDGTNEILKSSGFVVIPALDARMSEIYWSAFHACSSENTETIPTLFSRLMDDKVSSPSELRLPQEMINDGSTIIGVGNGWDVKEIDQSAVSLIESELLPHAFDLAILAEKYFAEGKTMSAFDAQPTYIRNEVSWAKRKRIR
ncbi:MAG: tRNA (adenosine(37)-N6)-threonylcarbamoyltransferase complex dimerization subunit type 1 TsaB [Cellvibrionaceae bacterium]